MLISVSMVLFAGLLFGWAAKKAHIPALFGMIAAGILLGPGVLDLLDESLLAISADIRRAALIIILIRAGLKLNIGDLKKVGRPAVLMCFVPACLEIAGTVLLAPPLLGLGVIDAAVLGAVIGAVSPAVVVPRMIRLIDERRGTAKAVPQMILAGASVDDVFVIVLFSAFTSLAAGGTVSVMRFVNVPLSILTGALAGALCGWGLTVWFRSAKMTLPVQATVLFALSLVLNWAEGAQSLVPFAGLIAIMAAGMMIRYNDADAAARLSRVFDRLWGPAEIFLFVLVGASVAIESARDAGIASAVLVLGVLVFRMTGVFLCTLGTDLNRKERLFCMLAYTPKATVQAAIGGIPLAMGLGCGNTVLTVSVIAILLTAPLGALAIDNTYTRLLEKED